MPTLKEITVTLHVDTSGLEKKLKDLADQLAKFIVMLFDPTQSGRMDG